MPLYAYSAQTPTGSFERGVLESPSLDAATELLKGRGLLVTELQERGDAPPPPGEIPALPPRGVLQTDWLGRVVDPVPLRALQFFFRQLSVMLDAGIGPSDALGSLAKGTRDSKLASVAREAQDATARGATLSSALMRYPEVFSPLMLSIVRVGEEGGTLPEQCKHISEYIERDAQLRDTIKRETASPKLTVVASVGIILLTNFLVTSISAQAQTLPVPVMAWAFVLVVGVGAFLFARLLLPRPDVRLAFDRFVRRIPGLGPMVHGFAMAKFGRAFGALYRSGVPFSQALRHGAEASGNSAVREAVLPAVSRLERGESVTDALASTGAFTPLVLDMARTGETTGEMDQMLGKVADYYEEEGETQAKIAAKVVGVVCFLAVAVYVAFILISFYSGYFGRLLGPA
jgi:type II secretory pathway component PulF